MDIVTYVPRDVFISGNKVSFVKIEYKLLADLFDADNFDFKSCIGYEATIKTVNGEEITFNNRKIDDLLETLSSKYGIKMKRTFDMRSNGCEYCKAYMNGKNFHSNRHNKCSLCFDGQEFILNKEKVEENNNEG